MADLDWALANSKVSLKDVKKIRAAEKSKNEQDVVCG